MNDDIDLDYRPTDDEPFMNERQVAYFRRKLNRWKEDILRESRETISHLQDENHVLPDLADRASSETDRSLELRARDRQRKLISKIEAALKRIDDGTISGKIAKDVFEIVWTEGGAPSAIVEARGLKQVTDTGAIAKAVDDIIAANPDKVEQVKAKPSMLGWFVGQVMKQSGGKANPQAVNDILKAKLGI